MARKSTTSSVSASNGHPPDNDAAPSKRLVSDTNRQATDDDAFNFNAPGYDTKTRPLPFDASLLPNGTRSLSYIGVQAFGCGFTLASCCFLTAWLLVEANALWRLPAFFACLSLFHFLEYWTTARFNGPAARASSFLLFSNGAAYNVAHTLAAIEIIISQFTPAYQTFLTSRYLIATGAGMVVVGQAVRSIAMAQAGTNFNHTPQKTRKDGHVLVTRGIYGWLRHPSYFGFFWWALGTQILVGNKVCFLGYLVALWNFFHRRIRAEEITLVDFFGEDYEAFRQRTATGIPFIR